MGLHDRGLLRIGASADITIFDLAVVNDSAMFDDPHRPSVGIEYVIVNGIISLDQGKVTGQLGGRPLRGPGYGAGSRAHILHSRVEPQVVAIWIKDDWHSVVDR
jgi:N-acyl-D-aspartate/D-glutamate deacylase